VRFHSARLSYTSFEIGAPSLSAPKLEPGCNLSIEVPVTNIGAVVVPRSCSSTSRRRKADGPGRVAGFRPVKELRAFAKVWLDPGETMIGVARAQRAIVRLLRRRRHDWLTLVDRMPKTVFHHGPVPASLHRSSRAGTSIRVPTSSTSAGRPRHQPRCQCGSDGRRLASSEFAAAPVIPRGPADEVRDCRLRLDRTIDPVGSEQPSLRATGLIHL